MGILLVWRVRPEPPDRTRSDGLASGAGALGGPIRQKRSGACGGGLRAPLRQSAGASQCSARIHAAEARGCGCCRPSPSRRSSRCFARATRPAPSPALAIALLRAIESLLSAVVADGLTGGRHRSNAELLAQGVAARLRKRGVTLLLAGVHAQPLDVLVTSGVIERIGEEQLFETFALAVERARRLVGSPERAG